MSYRAAGMLLLPHPTSFLLPILLRLVDAGKTQGAHSLCLNLTVKSQHRPGQPWYEVQGSVDQKLFLQYDSDSNKATALGHLGKMVNATDAWKGLTQMLGEVGQELRMTLSDIKLEETHNRGSPFLQANISCQREAERCTSASLLLSFNGRVAILLDAMNMDWTPMYPDAREIMENLKSNTEMALHLRKLSVGDCNYWLREFLEHWEEMLEPPVSSSSLDFPKSSAIQLCTWILPTIIICSVLIVIIVCSS